MTKNAERAILLIIACIALLPRVLAWRNQILDPFAYTVQGVAQISLKEGNIAVHPTQPIGGTMQHQMHYISERTGITSLLVIFALVSAMPLDSLIFLPVVGFAFLLISFVIANRLAKSPLVGIAYVFFVAFEPSLCVLTNGIYYVSVGWLMFLIFLSTYFISQNQEKNVSRSFFPLLFLSFINTYFIYYTTEGVLILFLISIITLSFLKKMRVSFKFLTLALTLIFVTFDPTFYNYARHLSFQTLTDIIGKYVGYIFGNLFGHSGASSLRTYPGTVISFYVDFIVLISISIPVLVTILLYISKKRSIKKIEDIQVLALVLTAVGNGALYLTRGYFSFTGILLLFPLLTFVLINKSNLNKRSRFFIIFIILLLSPAKFAVYWTDEKRTFGDNIHAKNSSVILWVADNSGESKILTSLTLAAQLLPKISSKQMINQSYLYVFTDRDLNPMYTNNYTSLKQNLIDRNYQTLILSNGYSTHVIDGAEWKLWAPLGNNIELLSNYTFLNRVYSDARSIVYIFIISSAS